MSKLNTAATFSSSDHALTAGWATYHSPKNQDRGWRRWICRLFGHSPLAPDPVAPNGHSAAEISRCTRCLNWMKWYIVGQHRYGGIAAVTRRESEAKG